MTDENRTPSFKTTVINLFGGPNAGKTTTKYGLSYLMKVHGEEVETVQEFAKELVLNRQFDILTNQDIVTGVQKDRLDAFYGKTRYLISDSPLLLGMVYGTEEFRHHGAACVERSFSQYRNLNFLLLHDGDLPFSSHGRNESQEEAAGINRKVMNLLHDLEVPYYPIRIRPHDIDMTRNHVSDIYSIIRKVSP